MSKMFHYFQFKREEFLGHYHEQSKIETVFSMVQANELYCKFLCHNIFVLISSIYELGIAPEFWKQETA